MIDTSFLKEENKKTNKIQEKLNVKRLVEKVKFFFFFFVYDVKHILSHEI